MNILELLKADHEKVNGILSELKTHKDLEEKQKKDMFAKLVQEITVHTLIEEKLFYPALKEKDSNAIEHAKDAHEEVKKLLEETKDMSSEDDAWLKNINAIQKHLSQHIETEEKELFKLAEKNLDSKKLDEMAKEAEKIKKQEI